MTAKTIAKDNWAGTDADEHRVYALTHQDGSSSIAHAERDNDTGIVTIHVAGSADPVDPKTVTGFSRLAVVDHDWPLRVNDLYGQLSDARTRLANITLAAKGVTEQGIRGLTAEQLATDPDRLTKVLTAFETFAAQVDASLIPTKGGIIPTT